MEEEDGGDRKVTLKKWRWSRLKTDRRIALIGKTGMGKGVILRELLSHLYKEFDYVVAFCPTPESLKMFAEFMPRSFIFDNYDAEKVQEIVDEGKRMAKRGKFRKICILLDDLGSDKKYMRNEAINFLHKAGRHIQGMVVNLVQYAIDIPADLRPQVDYIFALADGNGRTRKIMYTEFFQGVINSLEEFEAIFGFYTQEYGALVVDKTVAKGMTESLFWYKAEQDAPAKMMCSRPAHKLHHMFFREPEPEPIGIPIMALAKKPAPKSTTTAQSGMRGAPLCGGEQASKGEEAGTGETKKRKRADPNQSKRRIKNKTGTGKNASVLITLERLDSDGNLIVSGPPETPKLPTKPTQNPFNSNAPITGNKRPLPQQEQQISYTPANNRLLEAFKTQENNQGRNNNEGQDFRASRNGDYPYPYEKQRQSQTQQNGDYYCKRPRLNQSCNSNRPLTRPTDSRYGGESVNELLSRFTRPPEHWTRH